MKIKKSIRQRPTEAKVRTLKPNQNRKVFLPLNTDCPEKSTMKIVKYKSSLKARATKSEEPAGFLWRQ